MAASSFAMQSILASPMIRVSTGSRVNHFGIPAMYRGRNVGLRVRSMAEVLLQNTNFRSQCVESVGYTLKFQLEEQPNKAATPVTPPPSSVQPKPQPPKVSTKFSDVLAFSGPAPERINGRLAMIGFVAAMAVEVAKGQGVFEQISNGGIPWFLGTSVVLTLASLIPLFQGVSVESKSKGFMSSDAELWNGRFAMLGLIALAFTEYVKGGTLV
ncbi:hypothetical protein Fmac_023502 [Flemingia macrophylla]|uniref:Early light-induced protein n=1 Tax=Flemingia macrophylla TaxID=520843 RepID=A0ABD1LLQ4_9FABA